MKSLLSALIVASALTATQALADGAAASGAAASGAVINFQETLITAEAADDAAVYALPVNASAALVQQRKLIDDKRAAFDKQRAAMAKLISAVDFEGEPGTGSDVTEALEIYRERLAELEEAETVFLQEKDLFLADAEPVQEKAAQEKAAQEKPAKVATTASK